MLYERYDSSMRLLTRMLKSYRQRKDSDHLEPLLQNFWDEAGRELAATRSWNILRNLSRRLDEAGAISLVVRFMWGVFHHAPQYDRARFREKLSSVPLSPELDAAQLCGDCFLTYLGRIGKPLPEGADPYEDDLPLRRNLMPGELTRLLPEYLARRLYGVSLDPDTITPQDVDRLAGAIMARTRERVEAENAEAVRSNEDNARREAEIQKQGHPCHIIRRVERTLTEFDARYALPGGLLELYRACELEGRDDICYYILEEYVWPVFAITPWEAEHSEKVLIMSALAGAYTDALFSQFLKRDFTLHLRRLLPGIHSEEQFFADLTGREAGLFLRDGIRLYGGHPALAVCMRDALQKGKTRLKASMDDYLFSFLMAFTPYLLLCTGQQEQATAFLMRHYDDISLWDKRLLYVQITLVRSILSADRLETAYTLYGYYTRDMDRHQWDRETLCQAAEDLSRYIREAGEYVRLRGEYTHDTNRSWYDVLFQDGRINGLLREVDACLKLGHYPDEETFMRMLHVADAFSYPTGIRLSLLDIPNQDNYDKLDGALSPELIDRGQGYVKRIDEYRAFYHSLRWQETRRNVDILLQHHISDLAQHTMEDSLARIDQLRQTMSAAEQDSESVLRRLEEVYDDISFRLLRGYLGREEIERHIGQMERDFIDRWCPGLTGRGLLSRLPLALEREIHDYLVTGEIVYRLLASRKDASSLDFSAALIPLTKAVEQILNHIYRRMDVRCYPELDQEVRKSYFTRKGTRKHAVEFGPGVWLLKDAAKLNVAGSPGNWRLEEEGAYPHPHFSRWSGDRVVDIAALRSLSGKQIFVDRWDGRGRQRVSIPFGSDDRQNRMLLAKGLDFIRENYRNIVAHKDPVAKTTVDECRDILLLAEDMLWILLSILRPDGPRR